MINLITRLLWGAFALLVVAYLFPGVTVEGIYPAVIAAVVLALLNTILKPILVVLTLPITIVTLGLFMFVINAGIFLFAASFIEGFAVEGFISAIIGSLAVSVLNAIGHTIIK